MYVLREENEVLTTEETFKIRETNGGII